MQLFQISLKNLSERKTTQNTFLEIAVYVWKVIINVESYPAVIIWSNGAIKSMK